MQFGDAKSDFRLHAFKSLGLHRNGSGQWRTHDHPWPKLNRQFRCSDCLVGLITDISTATKISAKPTSELHMIVSPQNSAENVTANLRGRHVSQTDVLHDLGTHRGAEEQIEHAGHY